MVCNLAMEPASAFTTNTIVLTVNKVSPSQRDYIFMDVTLCENCPCFVQQSVSPPLAASMGYVSSQDTVDVRVGGMEHSVMKVWSKNIINYIRVFKTMFSHFVSSGRLSLPEWRVYSRW